MKNWANRHSIKRSYERQINTSCDSKWDQLYGCRTCACVCKCLFEINLNEANTIKSKKRFSQTCESSAVASIFMFLIDFQRGKINMERGSEAGGRRRREKWTIGTTSRVASDSSDLLHKVKLAAWLIRKWKQNVCSGNTTCRHHFCTLLKAKHPKKMKRIELIAENRFDYSTGTENFCSYILIYFEISRHTIKKLSQMDYLLEKNILKFIQFETATTPPSLKVGKTIFHCASGKCSPYTAIDLNEFK